MYLPAESFDSFLSHLSAFETEPAGLILEGWREWLVVRLDRGNNLISPVLLKMVLQAEDQPMASDENERIRAAIDIVLEFLDCRDEHGLGAVMREHRMWLTEQPWFRKG